MNKTFLQYTAEDILSKLDNLSEVAVVFPNKRASLFFNEYLAKTAGKPIWSPAYITISDLFRQHSSLNVGDPIKLICDLHKSFISQTGLDETLDKFYGWGQLLLADFDDIDKNMADADKVFQNLSDYHNFDKIDYLTEEQIKGFQIYKKVGCERERVLQFLRFQKAVDGTYFAAIEPMYNVLSLVVSHFQDRFADQKWLIYDLKREYGYYYDLSTVTEVRFEEKESHLLTGMLSEDLMMHDEKLFQQMWKEYFKSIAIKERINPRLHRQHLPVRFWKYLTEKQK